MDPERKETDLLLNEEKDDSNDMKDMLNEAFGFFKAKKVKTVLISLAALVFIILIIALASAVSHLREKPEPVDPGLVITSVKSSVREIVNVSDLRTAEYAYNGVAKWNHSEAIGENIEIGYIQYYGKVRFGFDFSKITFEENEITKDFIIILPEMTYTCSIAQDKVKCIFIDKDIKKQYNTSEYAKEMYSVCEADLIATIINDASIMKQVKTYTTEYISQLVDPLLTAMNYSYSVKIGG